MTIAQRIEEEARLRILEELAGEPDDRLSLAALRERLRERWIIKMTPEAVQLQADVLKSMGAVDVDAIGQLVVATLTARGREHVEKTITLPGVKKAA